MTRKPRAALPKLRMFCFPYAGGGATVFNGWETALPPEVEVLPLHLPGRERRFSEAAFDNAHEMAPPLMAALSPLLDVPFVFFGHSMGALIAYELALRLSMHGLEPAMLMVSASRAPHLPPPRNPLHVLARPEFRAMLSRMGGTPPEILDNPEFLDLIEPFLRADFKLAETYRPRRAPSLSCAVRTYGGTLDEDAPAADLEAWQEVSTGAFSRRMFAGDHFYLKAERAPLLADIAAVVGTILKTGP
ncbi:thioesterase II family protein [Azospirillum sp. TSH100]|uniref:thioesterase II family protein n=1 Tax=Azospirillum sp. TSH100 TaxID=652764 RepID=UPI001304D4F2|nr:alpha/beta fold hydrolase [Azospirillum sp. TSH100]